MNSPIKSWMQKEDKMWEDFTSNKTKLQTFSSKGSFMQRITFNKLIKKIGKFLPTIFTMK